jgi:glutathione S-transferase
MDTEPEKYLINQWLMFQAASQGAIYAQVPSDHFICFLGCQADSVFQTLQAARKGNSAAVKHLQEIVKRTLGTVNDALKGKEYLVGNRCTISDLSFLNWDLLLDRVLAGDPEAASKEEREALFPHWASWHNRIHQRPSVQTAIKMQRVVLASES